MSVMVGQQREGSRVRAITVPRCHCGHAAGAHANAGCAGWHPIGHEPCGCREYRPATQPQYRMSLETARWRWWICHALWIGARRADAWRTHLEGSR